MMMMTFFSRPTAQTTWYQTLPRRQAQCILVSKPPSSPWDTIAGDTDGDGFCFNMVDGVLRWSYLAKFKTWRKG